MLCRKNFAILAPVAVVYDGGGVYLGGGSSVGALEAAVLVAAAAAAAVSRIVSSMCSPIGGRYKSWILCKKVLDKQWF